MTENELVEKLREMRENGPSISSMMLLFGIIFFREIEKLGPGAPGRIVDEYNRRGYKGRANEVPIRDGMNLSQYVDPHFDQIHRWRGAA